MCNLEKILWPLLSIHIYKGENRILIIPMVWHASGRPVDSELCSNIRNMENAELVGNKVLEALNVIMNEPRPDFSLENYDGMWEKNTKYKTWNSFWKNNLEATIYMSEEYKGYVRIASWVKSSRVSIHEGMAKEIFIPFDSPAEVYGEAVLEVFRALEEKMRDKAYDRKITLLNESTLSFIPPKERHFESYGDMGAMECYHSYSYIAKEGDESSADFFFSIAPEIDCDLSAENVKQAWENCYEEAESFEMKEKQKGIYTHCAEMRNKSVYKKSYFLKQEEDLILECGMMVYQPNRRKKLCEKLDGMFEEFAVSCRLLGK